MRVTVPYEHRSNDPSPIYLSVSVDPSTPGKWVPAFCDTINGRRVVWIDAPDDSGPYVWLRDRRGGRRVDIALT